MIFIIIILATVTILEIKVSRYASSIERKNYLDLCFMEAVKSTAGNLAGLETGEVAAVDKQRAVQTFFQSMYAALGILEDLVQQEQLQAYIPIIGISTRDGFYIYYSERIKDRNGKDKLVKRWSELKQFLDGDETFIYRFTLEDSFYIYDRGNRLSHLEGINPYKITFEEWENLGFDKKKLQEQKQKIIAESFEKELSYFCSMHNEIAKEYGIQYQFSLPDLDNSDFIRNMDGIGFFAFFQGYPLGGGTDLVYEQYSFHRGLVEERRGYVVIQEGDSLLYHKKTCIKLGNQNSNWSYFGSTKECALAGAFACKVCVPMGIHLEKEDR